MTIVALGSKKVDETDHDNLKVYCGMISPEDRMAAMSEARILGRKVLAGGKIDETIVKPNPKLDSTAHPLTFD